MTFLIDPESATVSITTDTVIWSVPSVLLDNRTRSLLLDQPRSVCRQQGCTEAYQLTQTAYQNHWGGGQNPDARGTIFFTQNYNYRNL